MTRRVLQALIAVLCVTAGLAAAGAAWKWSGSFGDKTVSLLIIGDVQVHERRADPTTAFTNIRETLIPYAGP